MIVKQNHGLNKHELTQLIQLAEICQQHDNALPKMYWDLLKTHRSRPGNFLGYQQHVLIAYLSYFLFYDDAAHISALVHPDYRQQGIFSQLLQLVWTPLLEVGIKKVIFSFPQKNDVTRKCLLALNAKFLYFEYLMERISAMPESVTENNLVLQLADKNNLELMAMLDVAAFNSDYSTMLQRFQKTIDDLDRQVWLVYLQQQCIGKAHVHFNPDEQSAVIHDVGILPSEQKKGYGTVLLKLVINRLIQAGYTKIRLEVIANNQAAIRVYERCQFMVREVYEYRGVALIK
ncbi:MAG TPA: GNAT family N-acetyltransferase [Gammaproteobacteria bacterium]|jgi:ribosomal protein S18 acetylase RimI-like enzyme|nr:GNAT family N-acetyltransferase [Gammaproteobacteria bacterium]